MRARYLSCGVWWGICLLAVLVPQRGPAQPQPKAPETDAAAQTDTGTNRRPTTARPDGLKQLENELFKPLQPFMPVNPLERVTTAPVRLPAPRKIPESKRVKEMLERRKNWVFMEADDLLGLPTSEPSDTSEYDRDGAKKEKLSPLEKFLEREDRRKKGSSDTAKQGPLGERTTPTDSAAEENADRSEEGRQRDLNSFFGKEGSKTNETANTSRSAFSEILGLGGNGGNVETPQQALARKARMEEFRQMLGLPGPAFASPAVNAFGPPNTANPMADPVPRVHDALRPDSLPGVTDRSSFSPSPLVGLGGMQATVSPGFAPPDLVPHLSAPSSLTPVLPRTETPKPAPPGSTFSIPKRPF